MAKAIWEGKECDVRVDSDLESNWSVSILSGEFDPVSLIQRPAAPVIIKVRAKTRWLALDQGLRSLKAEGKIADFTLEPLDGGTRTRATYTLCADPGGSIPAFIANSANSSALPELFAAVRRRAEAKRG